MSTLFVVDDNELDRWITKINAEKLAVFKNVQYFADGEPIIQYITEHKYNESKLDGRR